MTYIFVNFGDKEGPVMLIVVVALVNVPSWRLLLILSLLSFVFVIGDSDARIRVSVVQI